MLDKKITVKNKKTKINGDFIKFAQNPQIKRPLIQLQYGPYSCNGIIKHKPQKLHGLIVCLKKLKFHIELIPSSHLNVLKIVILGYEVHRINIKFLQFNIAADYDKVCDTVLNIIQEATERLYRHQNISRDYNLREIYPDLSYSSSTITSETELFVKEK